MKRYVQMFLLAGIAVLSNPAIAAGPKYETFDGCDEGRWKEWDSIIIGFDGYPDEQSDARSVRDLNRKVCAEWKSGAISADDAHERYSRELDAWVQRIEKRRARRVLDGAAQASG